MSYTFRVVFSGPCAYVPNIVEGDDPGKAKSWSVILPDIHERWPGEEKGDKVAVDAHRAVVQFPRAKFDTSAPPDIDLTVRDPDGGSRESGLFLLKGHRVTFDLPGAEYLNVLDQDIDLEIMASQDAVLELLQSKDDRWRRSMKWLPAMSWLCKDLQWFGNEGVDFFRKEEGEVGFPQKGTIAGHVLLKHGLLGTHEIDTVTTEDRPIVPTIWEFRPYCAPVDKGNRRQALAKSVALEASNLKRPVTITLTYRPGTEKTLTLKPEHCSGEVEIEIKNRELEEIFLPRPDDDEIERYPIDLDFRYMYTQAKGYIPEWKGYLLPHLFAGGDGGNETATCGGTKPSGFANEYQEIVNGW
jgi:hypothetical protein